MEALARRIGALEGWHRALAAAAAGALTVLVQAPYDLVLAGFLTFPVLAWMLRPGGRAGRRAFLTGWCFGLGYFVAGLWWIGNALLVEAEEFAWALPLAVLALPAFLALFYGLACLPAGLYRGSLAGRVAALAFGFGIAEWLRSFLFTGFPWNAIGYGVMPTPLLMQPVAILGMDAVNGLAVFLFATPALLAGSRRHLVAGMAGALGLAVAATAYGQWRLGLPEPSGEAVPVRIVQASIDQSEKWDAAARDRIFARHLQLSSGEGPTGRPRLVLWPETSVPFLFSDRPDALERIGDVLQEDQFLLAGAVRDEADSLAPLGRRFYNSVLAIDHDGRIAASADKMHLVPFGEYLPLAGWLERLGLRQLVRAPGLFSAASGRQRISLGGLSLLPLICYEIIFAAEVQRGAGDTVMIVNLTNDAWYGDTPGPHQHLRQAQVRAVETGRPVLRAANNGISAAIDSRGRILASLGLNEVGAIDARVVPGPFSTALYGRASFLVVLLLFFAIAAMMHEVVRLQPN